VQVGIGSREAVDDAEAVAGDIDEPYGVEFLRSSIDESEG
jgi:hypothetical protein